MQISYFVHILETYNKKTTKENFINFLYIIRLPSFFWNFGFSYVLNSIFSIFIDNKKFEIIRIINIIHFKNTIYLRSFESNKFIEMIQYILEVLWLVYLIKSKYLYEPISL